MMQVILKFMPRPALSRIVVRWPVLLLLFTGSLSYALPACDSGAKTFAPCELSFNWNANELPASASPYKNDLLNVEFRSPSHSTILVHAFWNGNRTLLVRFSPTEPGTWAYHVSSTIHRYDNHESTFSVADSGSPGFVNVANVRHWWTTNKQPHLWISAAVPFLEVQQPAMDTWLDARKHDGFTHIRGTLLTLGAREKPVTAEGEPNLAYFAELDDRILAANARGFTLDLLLADDAFVRSPFFADADAREPLVRYLAARYGSLNVTWQGIQHFEDIAGARSLLKELNEYLDKYDGYHHPRSTDARMTSSPLLHDGWMNYLIEACPNPQLGAVEHQFTEAPEIHIVNETNPDRFRQELWTATTNGEYPSISYSALQNEANVKAVQIWVRVLRDTRHWELEPYFDVDGARATGLNEVEYLAYAAHPGIVEITLPKHKYNPVWVNPTTGEEIPMKNYKGEVFSEQTPAGSNDWVLQVAREGHKASMLRSYYFESQSPPVQEIEVDPAKIPFKIAAPPGSALNPAIPTPFSAELTRQARATRLVQYIWWGEIAGGPAGARVLGVGASGTFSIPKDLLAQPGADLSLRVQAINSYGKAYELDKVYQLTQ